jgi:small subunit ribosomal protein S1
MEYGAFVDLGGVDGLLHISDIAWTRVANVGDVLSVGQQIEVKVLKIDPETRRIALGLKQLQAHPWDAWRRSMRWGRRCAAWFRGLPTLGRLWSWSQASRGWCISRRCRTSKRILKATEVVKVGDTVDAVILGSRCRSGGFRWG